MRDFKLPAIPTSTNKAIRFPDEMIERVETEIRGTKHTFSSFVVAAVQSALDSLEEQRQRQKPEA